MSNTPDQRHRQVMWRLDHLIHQIHKLARQGGKEMAALDDLKREVEETKTVQASAVTLITEIAQKLRDAIAAGDPAALSALAADLDASATTLADAVTANTPTP